jgi:hypothetical protein
MPYRVLAEAAAILEPVGLQEEAELPAKIMEEFMRVCMCKVGPSVSEDRGRGWSWDSLLK